jgi:hypothetical protein
VTETDNSFLYIRFFTLPRKLQHWESFEAYWSHCQLPKKQQLPTSKPASCVPCVLRLASSACQMRGSRRGNSDSWRSWTCGGMKDISCEGWHLEIQCVWCENVSKIQTRSWLFFAQVFAQCGHRPQAQDRSVSFLHHTAQFGPGTWGLVNHSTIDTEQRLLSRDVCVSQGIL